MRQAEPRLQSKLLAWLLGPLLALLVLDTAVTYWTSVSFSNLAHDRSLNEIAREVALHIKPNGAGPKLELVPAAERILLLDQDDRLFYKVWTQGGAVLGGDPEIAAPAQLPDADSKPLFYGDVLHGEPVRMVASWMRVGGAGASSLVLVQVAETLNKRNAAGLGNPGQRGRSAIAADPDGDRPSSTWAFRADWCRSSGCSARCRDRNASRPEPDGDRTACPAKCGRWWKKSTS